MTWNKLQAEKELSTWFTPRQPATNNYVDRGNLDLTIFHEFSQKGGQVLIYGPTGAGKTSLVLDNLEKLKEMYGTDYVRVTMSQETTLDSFIADVATELHLTRKIQHLDAKETTQNASAGAKFFEWVSTTLGKQNKHTSETTEEYYSGTDDFNILKEALFKRNTVLVVDDMENLSDAAVDLRIRLAEIAKNMSDESVKYPNSYAKIVFVGIADTADQLWHDVVSLKSRLATIEVPYLNAAESNQIIENGWNKAKLISSKAQIEQATFISTGIGKVVHDLGQKTGYAAIGDNNPVLQGIMRLLKMTILRMPYKKFLQ